MLLTCLQDISLLGILQVSGLLSNPRRNCCLWDPSCLVSSWTALSVEKGILCSIQSINAINQISISPISPLKTDSVAQQPDRCSNTRSLKLFRNINRPLGTPVSTGRRPSRKGMFWDVFWRRQPRWLNGQIAEGCFKGKGRMSWRPLRQSWSWSKGWTGWFLCLISVRVEREQCITGN